MPTWIEPLESPVPAELLDLIGGNPIIAQTLIRRGISSLQQVRAFLDPNEYYPASPYELPGMEIAVERLLRAIRDNETICVWGDFDVDGQTSTALLVSSLQNIGARVIYHIPLRETESHGMNSNVLETILSGKQSASFGWASAYSPVSLVLTCDTGVSASPSIDYARTQNVDVIVTDHHELPDELPNALAIINPQFLPNSHPLRTLPGVGVAYKLAEALFDRLGRIDDSLDYLDLVALGIVADLALQIGDARYLLQRGLQSIHKTVRPGLLTILEMADVDPSNLNEEHIAFEIAPRLNALGRLADANLAVELLTTSDPGRARLLANQIEGLNNQRKLQTDQVFMGAMALLDRSPELLNDDAIVLENPIWPGGVLGIVASRLVDRFHKPVALISNPDGKMSRGSARSVEGINITEALKDNARYLDGFGGHAMAAGFSIDRTKIDEFRRGLNQTIRQSSPGSEPTLVIDGYVTLLDLSLDFVKELEQLAPFGAGNPPLLLACRNLRLSHVSPVGREKEHLLATVVDEDDHSQQVIWWQGAGWPLPEGPFDLAFTVRTATYRGQRAMQVEWVDFKAAAPGSVTILTLYSPKIVNYRNETHPFAIVKSLAARQVQIWAEAEAVEKLAKQEIATYTRNELTAGIPLAIWTPPAGPEILTQVLQRIKPPEIYLFAVKPETDRFEPLIVRLAGLVKHILQGDDGQVNLTRLAASLAQREIITRKCLDWMAAKGYVTVEEGANGLIKISNKGIADPSAVKRLSSEIVELLGETRAYRDYYMRVSADRVIS
ncbi:MAG: recJ [Chloroflexi bacterium]|nr:recJ [Chloroflexota bacterium]